MSVSVQYQGQNANQAIIYIAGRLLAENNGLEFSTPEMPNCFLKPTPPVPGRKIDAPYRRITDKDDENTLDVPFEGRMHVTGYMQRSAWHWRHREKIRGFFNLPPVTPNTKDIVLHIRLTDYWPLQWVLDPSYYLEALRQLEGTFEKVYICTDEPQNATYFRAFDNFNPVFIHGTPEQDFEFMRSFDRIIIANSSFSYLVALLGYARKIYCPKQWNRVTYVQVCTFPEAVPLDCTFMEGAIRKQDITFVVPCMGRLEHIKKTVPQLIGHFPTVVVDWSCPDKTAAWVRESVPDATVVEIQGKKHFDLSGARNAGAAVVNTPLIGFIDADTIPAHNFSDVIVKNWTTGSYLAMPDMPGPGYGGLVICTVDDFKKAGRWDETAKGYGWEDIAFKGALIKSGVEKKILPRNCIAHIEHDDKLRTANYEIKHKEKSTILNRQMLEPRLPKVAPAPAHEIPQAPVIRVGMLCIATNKYLPFVLPLMLSAKQWLLQGSGVDVKWFVFSNWTKLPPGAVGIPVSSEPWPLPTLKRYHYFLSVEQMLRDNTDYLFYMDVDMLFTGPVGVEILSDLVATTHPGFYKCPRSTFTYETRGESTACVEQTEGFTYFAGGFQGGKTRVFLEACSEMRTAIEADLTSGVVAVHNDESHWNRYCIDHAPTLILPPAYCYSPQKAIQESREAIRPLITCVEKDHRKLRNP